MHAPVTPHARAHPVVTRHATRETRVLAELRRVLTDAPPLPLDLLGEGPVLDAAQASARRDALAHELVDRMAAARWDERAAPAVVTSVLATSLPEAEAALLRGARSRR